MEKIIPASSLSNHFESSQQDRNNSMTGAQFILRKLELLSIDTVFGIPGSHIDPLVTASLNTNIAMVIACHELSAGYMADGYSRSSNKLGVVFSISSPGSNNLITSANTARIERIPMLIISGDVPTRFSEVPAFQSGNHLGSNDDELFKVVTKYSKRVSCIELLDTVLERAITEAFTPPFGPAHLIVPYCVLKEIINKTPSPTDTKVLKYQETKNSTNTVSLLQSLIQSNKKLVFWIGDSFNTKEHAEQIFDLAEKFHIPVTTSYSGKGAFPETHNLALGNFGYAGSKTSKELLLSDDLDYIIAFDIEQNERNSLNWNNKLYSGKKLITINFPGCFKSEKYGVTIEDNPFLVLKVLHSLLLEQTYDNTDRHDWFKQFSLKESTTPSATIITKKGFVEPSKLVEILSDEMPADTIYFVDSGTHRIFPGVHLKMDSSNSFFSASTVAPLGWAIAAGIGSAFNREENIVIFTGDGCLQMHGIEIKTAVKHQKPILVVMCNNNAFGNVHKRYSKLSESAAELVAIKEIDWNLFFKSLGAKVIEIQNENAFMDSVREFLKNPVVTVLNVRTPKSPYIQDPSSSKSAFT